VKKTVATGIITSILLILPFVGCTKKNVQENKVSVPATDNTATPTVDRSAYVGFKGIDPAIKANVKIYRYYAGADKTCMDYAVKKLTEKYPGLHISIEHRSDSDGTAIKTWAAVGDLPDIFEITSSDSYKTLLDNDDLYCLDDAIKATGFYDLFSNGAVSQKAHTHSDGHQYSMADEVSHVFEIWYNKELFTQLGLTEPTNFEEFKNCIRVLKKAGKIPIALFGNEQWPGTALYSLACIAEGKDEGVEAINDGTAKITEEPFVKGAKKFAEIAKMGAFGSSALSTNYQQAFSMLFTGKAGFFVSGTWFWQTIENAKVGNKIDWCNYNVFADEKNKEAVKGKCVGGKIKEMQYSVNSNPPSGLDPYTVALLACEFEYYVRLCAAQAGDMTTVIGNFKFNGSESYTDFNANYGNFKTFTTLTGDMSNGAFVSALGNAVEMMVTGNYDAEKFISDLKSYGY
jgi:raffinose/stachyose/melibiose transport system substrate-binding protein